MDKDSLKFMSFVAFMEAKKEAERDYSASFSSYLFFAFEVAMMIKETPTTSPTRK